MSINAPSPLNFARKTAGLFLLATAATLPACEGPEVLPPSGSHPHTLADNVQLLEKQPERYELIGAIVMPVTPEMKFDDRGNADVAFDALKARASEMGANAVLLTAKKEDYDVTVGALYHGAEYRVPLRNKPRSLMATAIYVLPKSNP